LIKVSVLYPNTADCKFDMHYYLNQHMPMVQQKLGLVLPAPAPTPDADRAARERQARPTNPIGPYGYG